MAEEKPEEKFDSADEPAEKTEEEGTNKEEESGPDVVAETPENGTNSEQKVDDTPPLRSMLEVRAHLEEHWQEFIRETDSVRVAGPTIPNIPDGNVRRFVEYCLHRQQKFPLETAIAMGNKFRRNHLHIYKAGRKGITYITTIARKFREAETVLTPELDQLITVIEQNPGISLLELGTKLGPTSEEQEAGLKSLAWLIREGYVTEFENGTLLTYPRLATRGSGGKKIAEKGTEENPGKEKGDQEIREEDAKSEDLSVKIEENSREITGGEEEPTTTGTEIGVDL
jgi:hypothetical protein